jgi:1-deoxy-D-xylulose-5-phosphate reductoisomerase
MKHPIQYAFTYPQRLPSPDKSVDFASLSSMTFAKPDEETFRCLALAKKAGEMGGIMPTVLNAANEVAVGAFLRDEISFLQIAEYVEEAMSKYKNKLNPTIWDIIEVDRSVRKECI